MEFNPGLPQREWNLFPLEIPLLSLLSTCFSLPLFIFLHNYDSQFMKFRKGFSVDFLFSDIMCLILCVSGGRGDNFKSQWLIYKIRKWTFLFWFSFAVCSTFVPKSRYMLPILRSCVLHRIKWLVSVAAYQTNPLSVVLASYMATCSSLSSLSDMHTKFFFNEENHRMA